MAGPGGGEAHGSEQGLQAASPRPDLEDEDHVRSGHRVGNRETSQEEENILCVHLLYEPVLVKARSGDIIIGMRSKRTNDLRPGRPLAGLDRTDIAILALLQNNARLSVKEIAAEVDLAPSSTHERIRRMWETDVLRGLHVEVNPKALGIGLERS